MLQDISVAFALLCVVGSFVCHRKAALVLRSTTFHAYWTPWTPIQRRSDSNRT